MAEVVAEEVKDEDEVAINPQVFVKRRPAATTSRIMSQASQTHSPPHEAAAEEVVEEPEVAEVIVEAADEAEAGVAALRPCPPTSKSRSTSRRG